MGWLEMNTDAANELGRKCMTCAENVENGEAYYLEKVEGVFDAGGQKYKVEHARCCWQRIEDEKKEWKEEKSPARKGACKTCNGTGTVERTIGGDGYGGRCAAEADVPTQCPDCQEGE